MYLPWFPAVTAVPAIVGEAAFRTRGMRPYWRPYDYCRCDDAFPARSDGDIHPCFALQFLLSRSKTICACKVPIVKLYFYDGVPLRTFLGAINVFVMPRYRRPIERGDLLSLKVDNKSFYNSTRPGRQNCYALSGHGVGNAPSDRKHFLRVRHIIPSCLPELELPCAWHTCVGAIEFATARYA